MRVRNSWMFVCAAGLALVLKVCLALYTIGTNDALTWDHDLLKVRTSGAERLYREGVEYSSPAGWKYPRQEFIHPPGVVNGLRGLGVLQDASGLPLHCWLRVACAIADIGTLWVVWSVFRGAQHRMLTMLIALSPVSILISGFHGNTDPIMICFVVVCVYSIERRRMAWSAVAFGLAVSVKLVPTIFVPTLLLSLPDWHSRIKWTGLAAVIWAACSMPYLAQEPILIFKTMLTYESARGLWGLYFLSSLLKSTALEPIHTVYAPVAKWIALLAVASLPLALRCFRVPLPLFFQCGMVVFLFLLLSPGFGLQYLAWTVPFVCALGIRPTASYYAVTGTCILTIYAAASRGMSNYYADVFNVSMLMRISIRLVCWVTIAVIACRFIQLATIARACSKGTQPAHEGI